MRRLEPTLTTAVPAGETSIEETTFPCSPAQRRFWIAAQMAPDDPALNVSLRWEIVGAAQPAQVERALVAVLERHETLRTRIDAQDGEPVQKVSAAPVLRFSTIDLAPLAASERELRAEAIAREEARTPFDIAVAPLQRFTLLRLAPERAWLLLTFHHAVFDGGSIDVALRDFATALDAVLEGRAPSLAAMPLHYGDYALWRRAVAESGALEEGRDYWRRTLRDLPVFDVPADHARRGGPHPSQIVSTTLDAAFSDAMEARARDLGATLFALNAAAVAACLGATAGRCDVVFSTQATGRDHVELEGMIGVFVNNVVLRLAVEPQAEVDAFSRAVNARVREALGYADTPFGDIVDIVNPPREPGRAPVASINFTLLGKTRDAAASGVGRVRRKPSFSPGAQYDLNFFVVHWPEGWRLALEYDATLFEPARAGAILDAWKASLAAVVAGEGRLGDVAASRRLSPSQATASAPRPAEASRADIESDVAATVAAVWRDALGVDAIGPESDFFALGGHSLTAIRIAPRIAAATGLAVNVMDVFNAPRFRDFVARLGAVSSADWRVTPIGAQSGAPTAFAIENSFAYRALAERLAGHCDLIGLQLFDPTVAEGPGDRSLESIAADYVALIRRRQPRGPYRLMGLCASGVIAFEATRQLEAAGETVEWLAMFDCVAPGALRSLSRSARARFVWSYRWIVARRNFALWRAGAPLAEVLRHYRLGRRLLPGGAAQGRPWFDAPVGRARAAYRPTMVKAATLIVHSDELDVGFARAGLGWRGHVRGPLRVDHASGWHADMLRDGVEALAAALLDPPGGTRGDAR